MSESHIKKFENNEIRTVWDPKAEEYYISVVDMVGALTESKNPRRYWSDLKRKLKEEGSQLYDEIVQLKMKSKDGKYYNTDVATVKQMFRIIQSIPSPKAEPVKQWLAQLGQERLDEITDPELAFEKAIELYRQKGYTEEWITQRLRSIEMRKDLTYEWKRSGVKEGLEYAILTDEISKAWSGKTTREYKDHKGLRKESLRDNMTNIELVLNSLAEVSTTQISRNENPKGFEESKEVAKAGGNIAGEARRSLEERLGRSVISSKNADKPKELDESDKLE